MSNSRGLAGARLMFGQAIEKVFVEKDESIFVTAVMAMDVGRNVLLSANDYSQ